MPWKESTKMEERKRFVMRYRSGVKMVELCREYGISRKTGYKFAKRFAEYGEEGLLDRSRRPHRLRYEVSDAMKQRLLGVRKKHPTWGAKKLKAYLERTLPGVRIPACSTIHLLLKEHGFVQTRRRRKVVSVYPHRLRVSQAPNDIWCVDFKGQFRLQGGQMCYPLTITDHYSRKILACVALGRINGSEVARVFRYIFERFGLPRAIRSDNGAPFASRALGGLSKLSVWWLSLGVVPERIEPGHPEQNGRHERMHRTLKAEATRPAANTLLGQQERFDRFVTEYNTIRPHEALEMRTPDELYQRSAAQFVPLDTARVYALDDLEVMVSEYGHVQVPGLGMRFFLSTVVGGSPIGLRELADGAWLVSYMQLSLGLYQPTPNTFEAMEEMDFTQIHNEPLSRAA